jgi:hypothetical protein
MRPKIIVEGRTDAEFLKRMLEASGEDAEVIAAGGRSSALSYARSLLAHGARPIALVLDSETTQESAERDQQRVVSDLLRITAPPTAFKVFFATPELETVFFFDTSALVDLIGLAPSGEVLVEARYSPKHALETWLATGDKPADRSWLINHLTPDASRKLAKHRLIKDLLAFIRSTKDGQQQELAVE